MKLLPFESNLWEIFTGAYGNVCEEVRIIMGDVDKIPPQTKLRRLETEEKEDVQIAYDNLIENLWHQMSFYPATYLAMPYLVKYLEKKEAAGDFDGQLLVISNMGIVLATDFPSNKEERILKLEELESGEIIDSYKESIFILQEKTKKFLDTYQYKIKDLDPNTKSEFLTALLAILGDREAAHVFVMSGWQEFSIFCSHCEYDECIDFSDLSDPEFRKMFTPASAKPWDLRSFDDTFIWYSHVLRSLGADNEADILSYCYGTFTCPECGASGIAMDFMKCCWDMYD